MPTLDWLNRDAAFRAADEVPYRLLQPVSSHGDGNAHNLLVQGDNLEALKALLPLYRARVKCIFIDPPYNTKSAFEHYDDNLEHSQWLSMMLPRLQLLREFLREDGSIWVTIDDNEGHYLKVLMDEVFGRGSFVANCVWQKRYSRDNNSAIGDVHDYVLCYATRPALFRSIRNRVEPDERTRAAYRNPNDDPEGPWRLVPMTGAGIRPNQQYGVTTPSGKVIYPSAGRHWGVLEPKFLEYVADGKVFFGKHGDAQPGYLRYFSEVQGLVPWTWWPHDEVGHTDESKKEANILFGGDVSFGTPKPERLIQRILHIASNSGDLILDSFLGSGTTAAVAHKMGRRWIMVELGEHCHTHIIPRLTKVIDGQDPGGVTDACQWKGGGGFRYFKLGPSLLMQDKWGQWVISKEYNPAMLAEALCKLEGFRYEPSESLFWMQGRSTERDFLYCTTQTLSAEQLQQLSEEVGPERSLLVLCSAFRGKADRFENLTVKKIPKAVLNKCEWGHDDYSLKVENLPKAPKKPRTNLFDAEDGDA